MVPLGNFFKAKMKKKKPEEHKKKTKEDRRDTLVFVIFDHSKVKSDLEVKYSGKLVLHIPIGLG